MTSSNSRSAPKPAAKKISVVEAAADAMIRASLDAADFDLRHMKRGSVVVLHVVLRPWLEYILDAAKRMLPARTKSVHFLTATGYGWKWSGLPPEQTDDLVALLLRGKSIVAITDDPKRLPSTLVKSADRTVRIAEPTWSVVRTAADAVGLSLDGHALPDWKSADIEPDDLLLGLRSSSHAEAWLKGLGNAAANPTSEAPTSPLALLAEKMVADKMPEPSSVLNDLRRHPRILAVEVPSQAWVRPVEIALRKAASDRPPPVESETDDELEVEPTDGTLSTHKWVINDGTARSSTTDQNDRIHSALEAGNSVIGITQDLRLLPKGLTRAPDHVIRVQPPTWSMIREVIVAAKNGEPSGMLSDVICRTIEPGDIRLAFRINENADQCLARLQAITKLSASGSGPTLADMHGMDEAVSWGNALARDLALYADGQIAWSAVDRGALLYGPPGTGKTTFAAALARTCNVPLITGSLSEWQAAKDGHLGDCLRAMREAFNKARAAAPCIMFIDEIDSFGDRQKLSERHRSYDTQVINAFLELLDGVGGRPGVVVVGACNNPARLDAAIVRSGRLDRSIYIGLPDEAGLAGIMRHHLGADLADVDPLPFTRRILGMTGADVERLVREARRRARTAGRPLEVGDVTAELPGSGSTVQTPLMRRLAVHEAGHAVAHSRLFPGSVISANIHPDRSAGGITRATLPGIMTRDDVESVIMVALSGRAAEELIMGSVSSGAGGDDTSDLAKATMFAARYFAAYGLDDESLAWTVNEETDDVLAGLRADPDLRQRVSTLLGEKNSDVHRLLDKHRKAIVLVAAALMAEGALSGAQIDRIIASAGQEERVAS